VQLPRSTVEDAAVTGSEKTHYLGAMLTATFSSTRSTVRTFELHYFFHSYDGTAGMTSIFVTGGPSPAAGVWRGGVANIFAGASSGNYIGYGVTNAAHVGIRDIWNDARSGATLT
jgi:hypothetical protein